MRVDSVCCVFFVFMYFVGFCVGVIIVCFSR